MSDNLKRFRTDLTALIESGTILEISAKRYSGTEGFDAELLKYYENDQNKLSAVLKNIPDFRVAYEPWYSEALRVVTQLLPDRIADFRAQYEIPKGRNR